jgi:hypothetical protein
MKTAIESVLHEFDKLGEKVDKSIAITIALRYLQDNKNQIINAHAAGQLTGMQNGITSKKADEDYFKTHYNERLITI